ncbi:hypothetical protein ABEF93_000848 [Exophiala dermatitidis]
MTDQNHSHSRPPGNDPTFRASSYPWMAHMPPVHPDDFPRASGPPVYEGFVPHPGQAPHMPPPPQSQGPQPNGFPPQSAPESGRPYHQANPAQPALLADLRNYAQTSSGHEPGYHGVSQSRPMNPYEAVPRRPDVQSNYIPFPQEKLHQLPPRQQPAMQPHYPPLPPSWSYQHPSMQQPYGHANYLSSHPSGPYQEPPATQPNVPPNYSLSSQQPPGGQTGGFSNSNPSQLNQLLHPPPPETQSDYIPFPREKLNQLELARETWLALEPNRLAAPRLQEADTSADEDDISADDADDTERTPLAASPNTPTGRKSRKRGAAKPVGDDKPPRKRRKKGTGTRGGWSKGLKIGPRPPIDPGAEFNQLHKSAMNAFIDDQDTEKALELILKAIAVNPEIYAAHALLSEIYFAKGEDEKAIAALFSGAHSAPRDPEVWRQVASACLQRSSGNRQTALQQASYCYARIIHNDPKECDARLQRAALQRELGNYTKAMNDLEFVREHKPRDSNVLRQIAEVCIDTRDLDRAKSLYEEALAYYRDAGMDEEDSFTWTDILVYAQLLAQEEPADASLSNAIKALRSLSRWLLGREEETFWDDYSEDDREWDSEDDPRRTLVEQFVPGKHPLDTYGTGLPLELRVRLGVFRLRQGPEMLDEALAHFEWLEPDARDEDANVYDYPDLFLEAAQALHEAKQHEQALRYYQALKDINAYSDTDFWLGVAANSYICGNKEQAIECYEEAKAWDDNCIEARTQLSKLYADMGDKQRAMENAREAVRIADNSVVRKVERRKYERKEQRIAREQAEKALKFAYSLPGPISDGVPVERIEARIGRRRGKGKKNKQAKAAITDGTSANDNPDRPVQSVEGQDGEVEGEKSKKKPRVYKPRSKPAPKPKRMTAEEKEAYRTENVNRLYKDLVENTEAMRKGDEVARNTWMDCAESLITDFRSNRVFYPAERYVTFKGYDRDFNASDRRRKAHRQQGQEQEQDALENGDGDGDQAIPIPSVESTVPTEYREISFTEWLDVFLEYALLLANDSEPGSQQRCYNIITAALDCSVWYHDPQAILHIYVTYFTCALALRDSQTLFNIVLRWFMRRFQFCTDAYRLFAGMNFLFPHPDDKGGKDIQMANAHFRSGPSQKFMFRQVMAMDMNLPQDYNPEGYGPVPSFMRQQPSLLAKDEGDEDLANGEVITPKELDVVLLTLYGHILYAGGSFPNALSYFFRARSLDPKNPVTLLSIALAYMHELLKRQSDNRHMFFLQGWAFFEEYAEARREWAKSKGDPETEVLVEREILFNRARSWHMMGMSDLAVRAYAKLFSSATPTASAQTGKGQTKHADYTMEAAYAVQTLYALSGNATMARDISEKYLVV